MAGHSWKLAPRRTRATPLHAVLATLVTVAAPALTVVVLQRNDASTVVIILGTIVACLLTSAVSTVIWMRHPASACTSFSELMLWSWVRRERSAREIERCTSQLDDGPALSAAERLRVLREMSESLDNKDPYTYGHSRRVERLAHRTGLAMKLDARQLEVLQIAAAIHDVGKIHIPDRILRKEGRLTEREFLAIRAHAAMGAEMVDHMGRPEITAAVRHHHERWDGRGYPDEIAGADIPIEARIIGVADAFDAMTSTRPYRDGFGRKRASEILVEERNAQFDANVVDAFLTTLEKPSGVLLSLAALTAPLLPRVARFGKRSARQVALSGASLAVALAASAALVTPAQAPAREATSPPATDGDRVLGERVSKKKEKPKPEPERPDDPVEQAFLPPPPEVPELPQERSANRRVPDDPPATPEPPAAVIPDPTPTPTPTPSPTEPPPVAAPETAAVEHPRDHEPGTDPRPDRGQECIKAAPHVDGGSDHCDT